MSTIPEFITDKLVPNAGLVVLAFFIGGDMKKVKKVLKQRRAKMPKKAEIKKAEKKESIKESENVIQDPNETLAYEA